MPYCKRCGELGRAEKCKKCGTSFADSFTSASCESDIDRWQSCKYLDQVVGPEKTEHPSTKKKWMERRKIPSLLIDKKYRIAPLDSLSALSSTHPNQHSKQKDPTCSHCHQQLAGKLVQLPDESRKKYHWSCLLCHECHQPFQTTNFYLDSLQNVYHPKCATAISPTVEKTCHQCGHHIFDQYIAIHSSVLHPECFQCSECHNVLKPASFYCHKNQGLSKSSNNSENDNLIVCRPCHQKQSPQDQYTITLKNATTTVNNHNTEGQWFIVPQPLFVQRSTGQLTYHSPTTPTTGVDQVVPPVQPSDLMSSKHYSNRKRRPLPQFGTVKVCPGCQNRIESVHEERTGPRAAKWHRQCLVCCSCNKVLDSSAKVHQALENERLIPSCTTCLVRKFFF
ncbi:hypothetical protein BCR42DRAFT_333528 [Absidia repens]|uniref:LIM zinc-binding domain-containing protein n=1 Tax=Absidia repens TaxID=90262 RepID=A0A1X2I6Q1_9FUNG|nr:hypothetical protein BCR42DRAFT_333528 [Absidia repens]